MFLNLIYLTPDLVLGEVADLTTHTDLIVETFPCLFLSPDSKSSHTQTGSYKYR